MFLGLPSYVWPFFERAVLPVAGLANLSPVDLVENRRADSRNSGVISKASRTDFVSPRLILETSAPFNNLK